MKEIVKAEELISIALHDLGMENLVITNASGDKTKLHEAAVNGCWLPTLMMAVDRAAIFIADKRIFNVNYVADSSTVDGISVVEDSGLNYAYNSIPLFDKKADGAALEYQLIRSGIRDALVVSGGDRVQLRQLVQSPVPNGAVIDLPSKLSLGAFEFRKFCVTNSNAINRSIARQSNVTVAPSSRSL